MKTVVPILRSISHFGFEFSFNFGFCVCVNECISKMEFLIPSKICISFSCSHHRLSTTRFFLLIENCTENMISHFPSSLASPLFHTIYRIFPIFMQFRWGPEIDRFPSTFHFHAHLLNCSSNKLIFNLNTLTGSPRTSRTWNMIPLLC